MVIKSPAKVKDVSKDSKESSKESDKSLCLNTHKSNLGEQKKGNSGSMPKKEPLNAGHDKASSVPKLREKEDDFDFKRFFNDNKGLFVVIAAILAIFLIFFGAGYLRTLMHGQTYSDYHPMFKKLPDNYTYHGLLFRKSGPLWKTDVRVKGRPEIFSFTFRYSPKEVEDIPADSGIKQYILGGKELYLTADSNIGSVPVIGMSNIGRLTGTRTGIFNIPTHGALTTYDSRYNSTPVVTCNDASDEIRVVWFKFGNQTRIINTGMCVIVEGKDGWELVRAADKISYIIMGIM